MVAVGRVVEGTEAASRRASREQGPYVAKAEAEAEAEAEEGGVEREDFKRPGCERGLQPLQPVVGARRRPGRSGNAWVMGDGNLERFG